MNLVFEIQISLTFYFLVKIQSETPILGWSYSESSLIPVRSTKILELWLKVSEKLFFSDKNLSYTLVSGPNLVGKP